MFTGIIEDVGVVQKAAASVLLIGTVLTGIRKGDSVSINGTCLTVTKTVNSARIPILSFDVSPETVQRTNLGELRAGSKVNVERALRVGDRFGGHIMMGHVEDKGKLARKERADTSWLFTFTVKRNLQRYIVSKGSVGVDGISLTVADCGRDFFTASVIPHTIKNTNLGSRSSGDNVNIELDILAKYAESMLIHCIGKTKTIEEVLRENGFNN